MEGTAPLILKRREVQGNTLYRAATLVPGTYNAQEGTIEVCWTTGARGQRSDWFGESWMEELAVDASSVRMERMNAGAVPFLKDHDFFSVDSQIGRIVEARLEKGQGLAKVKLAKREEVQGLIQDIVGGVIANISVGYKVYRWEELEEKDNGMTVHRAVDWEPKEISIVTIGFDLGAQTRRDEPTFAMEFFTRSGLDPTKRSASMEPEGSNGADGQASQAQTGTRSDEQKPAPAANAPDDGARVAAAAAAERQRVLDIQGLVRRHGLEDSVASDLVQRGASIDAARAAVLEAIEKRGASTPTRTGVRIEGGVDEVTNRRTAMEMALLSRFDPGKFKTEGKATEFRHLTLLEMARTCCEAAGISTATFSKSELAARAFHSTSDFPLVLANTAGKSLRTAYDAAPQTFLPFTRKVEVPDFKEVSRVQLGEAPALLAVGQGSEYKRGTLGEAAETYALAKYGRVVAITREAIINDDLNAFTRIPMLMGRAAANLESDLVYAIFNTSVLMGDGVALFDNSAHKNVGTTGAISDTTLGEARTKMRRQTGIDGVTLLNLFPKFLLVPATKETLAKKYLASEVRPTAAADVNPFAGELTLIVEPRLDAVSTTAYFVIADPGQIDIIELAYLQGQSGPYFETRAGFDVDGMEMKIRHEVAAKAIDWRGMVKNAGS